MTGDGYLSLWFLGERHADGIANAVGEQRPYAHGTLDTSVLAFARLGHSEMEWIVHILLVHLTDQQAHGAHHYHRVACLDGDDNICEILLLANTQKLHTALHDTLGSIAVARHDTVRERTVVDAYAHSCVMLLADIEEGHETLFKSLQFCGIFLISIFQMSERAGRVNIVAWIDPYLLGI